MAVNNLIQVRRGTASDWSSNPTLAQGEPGFDTTNNILKIGDGTTAWNSLSAVNNTDHPSISAASSSDNSGNTFIQDLTLDSNGHVTAIVVATATDGGGGGGISSIAEDTTPQLGGNLELNSKDIIGAGDINVTGHMILQETMPDHCGIQIKSSGDVNGELHVGSCSDAAGVANAMGIKHSTMTGANDYMICANTDGATFVSAKDTKSLTLTAGGNSSATKLELRDNSLGFRFNVNKSNVDLQYNGDNENNVFYIDASADSIGVGTSAPQTRLDVSGVITGSGFKTQHGTSSQFLKADGSVDTNTYSTTDTQLTEEQVEDFVGGMVTGNTETGITVTYDDSDGTLDFVVASQTDENFTTADHSKLDGIEANADVTDTANVTAAGALMDSELTDLAGVKGVTISTLQVKPSEGAFVDGDKTKLDGIEASADVTDTANVTSAGALMDSEVTNLSQVKAFDSSDYATAAQGTKADSAQQPPSEGAFANGDKTKLDGIEASADVTDTANVTSAGALMDSELASIADVKALDQSVVAGASPNFVTTNMTDASDKRFMTDAQETKLDSVESNADVTDTANVTAAGALMDSELTDLAGVKGVTISTLQSKPSEGAFANGDKTKLDGIEANATADQTDEEIQDIVGAMLSGNTETGITVTYQDADGTIDFVVASQTDENFTTADHSKLDGIEASADVTDATNVDAAGAVMNSDSSTASMSFVVDEDNMASDSATKVPTQQSVKAYVDANAGGGGLSNIVEDTTPQLGGDLDVNGKDIVTTSNGNIDLDPNGTGKVVFKGNGSKGAGQFVLNCENNSHGIVIKGPPHSAGASYTLTLPNTDGSSDQVLKTDGSGNLDWVDQSGGSGSTSVAAISADATISSDVNLVTTANTDRTVTLPSVSSGKIVRIKKVDAGTGTVIIARGGSSTIDGATQVALYSQFESMTIICDGTNWHVF